MSVGRASTRVMKLVEPASMVIISVGRASFSIGKASKCSLVERLQDGKLSWQSVLNVFLPPTVF